MPSRVWTSVRILKAETNYGNIPGEAVCIAKRAILDWVGVTIAGSNEPAARIVSEQVRRMKILFFAACSAPVKWAG